MTFLDEDRKLGIDFELPFNLECNMQRRPMDSMVDVGNEMEFMDTV